MHRHDAQSGLPDSAAINLRRLVVLRWMALAGQGLAVWVAARWLELPLAPVAVPQGPRTAASVSRFSPPAYCAAWR